MRSWALLKTSTRDTTLGDPVYQEVRDVDQWHFLKVKCRKQHQLDVNAFIVVDELPIPGISMTVKNFNKKMEIIIGVRAGGPLSITEML